MLIRAKIPLFVVFITLLSCGIKGPPLPPIEAETIQKQKASEVVSADASKPRAPEKK